jgi:carboxymethylenebutenolidase
MGANERRAIWAEHCRCEFELRDVDATLQTMTDDPHLLNVPTGHGGDGLEGVRRFYAEEFLISMPDDTAIESLGLAVGTSRLTEEVVMTFTHDRAMEWILPGIEPTGRRVRIPQLAVVGFLGERIQYEHIWWDQASVLAQVGVLDSTGLPVLLAEEADLIQRLGDAGD